MAVTIKHVARAAGVSVSTVSRVITGDGRISEPTSIRVREVMASLGYHPNAIARSLVQRRSYTIGLVMSRAPRMAMSNPFFPEIVGAIAECAAAEKYHLLLVSSSSREEECAQVLELLRHRRVDGVIHPASRVQDRLISALLAEGFPFVVIGRVPGTEVPSVNNDNIAAGEMAVSHLLDQGYRTVAYLGGSPDLVVTQDRLEGYRRALARRSIDVLDRWVLHSESTPEAALDVAERLLSLPDRPRAAFAMDDTVAAAVLRSARKHGLKVPDDLAVVGFNDDPTSVSTEPALTTVRIPIFEMGLRAARMLIGYIRTGVPPASVVVPCELVVRQSSVTAASPA